jgi:hypothetical protein
MEDAGWTEMERGALINFLSMGGPLKSALEKFVSFHSQRMKASCAEHMATVPRGLEHAADYAAKAQFLDEFWVLLADDALSAEQVSAISSQEPTL